MKIHNNDFFLGGGFIQTLNVYKGVTSDVLLLNL